MPIVLQIPRVLQDHCAGKPHVELHGDTVAELLGDLRSRYPTLYACVCDETGAVRRHIHLFVNNDFLQDRNDFHTRLKSGDVVSVFQAVSGG